MTELSKFINCLIEFEQKVQGHLNKKYKPFIRKMLNLQSLAKNVPHNKVTLTKEFIVFKLGLQAKSHKAVEISLNYLLKLLQNKFVDLNQPNYCQIFSIQQNGLKQLQGVVPTQQIRHQLIALIRHVLHYKSQEINQLVVKVLQFLITEPILELILDATVEYPHQSTAGLLANYFSFRFHVYEEICCYTEPQMKSFETLTLRSQKTQKQIRHAKQQHKLIYQLVQRYMVQYMSIINGDGGRYGRCVMCNEPAQHYCKVTKASLCGIDCKKRHIQLAQKQYKHHFQANHLWQSITTSFQQILIFLQTNQNPLVFNVLSTLLDKPYLFMIAKKQFRTLLARHVPPILTKILQYRSQASFQHIYYFMANLTKYWLFQCIAPVQYFFKEYIIKVLQEKKPTYRFLNMVFKALARIFQHGKVTIQLYINFDCEVNKDNLLEKVLFQLAKIIQDRYAQTVTLSKNQRQSSKNNCLSLFIIMSMGLNQYRKQQNKNIDIQPIVQLKQKKISLEQFVVRFNEHWTTGLKTLFNLNLVGLDSNEEIVDIIINLKGLSKENIAEYFSCEKGSQLYEIFLEKLISKHRQSLFMITIDLFHYLPLSTYLRQRIEPTSVCIKKFAKKFQQISGKPITQKLQLFLNLLNSNYSAQDFSKFVELHRQQQQIYQEASKLLVWAVQTKQILTSGNHTTYFTYCCSHQYLEVISNQIALLQIPVSYLLENDYQLQRILNLTQELVQICPNSNWLALLIKNSAIERYPSNEFDQYKLKIVIGVLNIMEKEAPFIQNWATIVHFVAKIHHLLVQAGQKKIVQGKVALSERINVGIVQRSLLEAGAKTDTYFGKFLLAVLAAARQLLEKEQTFMIHKFFEIVDSNCRKFLLVVQDFMPYLLGFTKQLQNASPEICISVGDMLKQSFAKLLKTPKPANSNWNKGVEAQFWQLFLNLSNNRNKQVSDFVVSCITMTILHHYDLSFPSWTTVFAFMKNNLKHYRHQVFTIVEKIANQKMNNCHEFYSDLVDICLELVHPEENKISIEALHILKTVLDIICQMDIGSSGHTSVKEKEEQQDKPEDQVKEEEAPRKVSTGLNSLLLRTEQKLISFIFYFCHQNVLQMFFRLLKIKLGKQYIISSAQLNGLVGALFRRVEDFRGETLQISQKTINYALTWSVQHKYPQILSFYKSLILDKYSLLSLSAIKCIKTYIQMLNPKTRSQWSHIQHCLLSISQNTHLSHHLDLSLPDKCREQPLPIGNIINDEELKIRVDINRFANMMVVQKSIVEVMPNHLECLEEVVTLHKEIVTFNDNLYLRVLLWRRGLGSHDPLHPPNLLSLEQTITGKLVAIYNSAKQQSIIDFALKTGQRYCQASSLLLHLQQPYAEGNAPTQMKSLLIDYVTARKIPLIRVMNYFLPKFGRYCQSKEEKKQVVLMLVQCCKYVENREPFLKIMRELAKQ